MVLRICDLALELGERLASRPARFILGGDPPNPLKKELSGPQNHLDTSEMKGMCYRCRESARNFLGRPTHTLVHLPPVSYFGSWR
jgi:hypothetical protein